MHGRTCLVTGANRGVGKAAAMALARAGARVALICRDRSAGEAALRDVRAIGDGELFWADLSSRTSVRELARELWERLDALHLLVHNAGVFAPRRRLDPEGLELTFSVNHLAPFLLTSELVDLMKRSSPARIVVVSSEAHRRAQLDLGDLQLENGYDGMRAYANSKLCNLLFARELSTRLEGSGVTVNSLHPGVFATGLLHNYLRAGCLAHLARPILRLLLPSTARGGEAIAHAATTESAGLYFVATRATPPSSAAQDPQTAARLWAISEELLHPS